MNLFNGINQDCANVLSRYNAKGAEAARKLLRLYLAMLYPVFLVSVWMFAIFAFTSYMVPKVFCKKTVISSEVGAIAIYSHLPTAHLEHVRIQWPCA